MSTENNENIVYSAGVIELITAGVEFCSFIENETLNNRDEWIHKMLRLLPLIYMKVSQLPELMQINDELPETFVKEEDYVRVSAGVANIMGEEDVYLDVFMDEMKYSDRPISSFVSENIADVYQDIRNLVSIYQYNLTEQMNDALYVCQQHFRVYWGQKLINVLRPLHSVLYNENDEEYNDEYNDESELNMEDLWA